MEHFSLYSSGKNHHPQEDHLIASASPPVFVVADGVTLNFKKIIADKKEYPDPSPAGEVAKIFCETVIESAKRQYEDLKESNIKDIFIEANRAVGIFNNQVGKSNISGNVTGFYAATGSFVIIKNNHAYWAAICDAFFAHFDKNMNAKFVSSGVCTPYAVINGEDKMAEHLENGVRDIETSDRVFVFTDGFEYYFKNPDFLNLFKDWTNNLSDRITRLSGQMSSGDPEKYGHERSLIAP